MKLVVVLLTTLMLATPALAQEPPAKAPQSSPADCALHDEDGDGVNDCDDQCPGTPRGTAVAPSGCEIPVCSLDMRSISFASGSSVLPAQSREVLDDHIKILLRYPQMKFEVAGHTDACPSPRRSARISLARARVAHRYLLANGIAADRITGVKGYGASRPLENTKEDCASEVNRRVELNIQN